MLTQLIEFLGGIIVAVISATGYLGILVLMTIESACIPLPSEITMPFAGYLVSTGQLNLWLVALAGALGCNIGSTIAYAIGYWGGRPLAERWGRYVLLSTHDIDVAERFFARYGVATVFIGRLLPVVRTFIALPAGFAEMNMWKFQIYSFIGSFIWCLGLAYLGEQLGIQWNDNPALKAAFHNADIVIGALLVLGVAWFVWNHLRRRRRS
ncbi:MAG: DedA family protein [Devosia sp.]|nr:DedA family protein [Devosia sp.]